ncbi:DUF4349 domain-containing protein [Crassaminicella thermophila]|uniref:DUF4349 domain-containing protein n=1 Tax=Crassaminicella thermophila TaxID=2599308 RepID=A0A5C0SH83_CRATE|nr:DUF4349 domain-containing protein [Crassaminicella thermophila]QEK12329.1 DUF4349 domain-containing protein [Crassaminicella thermophila]
MRCTEMEELISLYIDDMLDDHTKKMIDRHLKECPKCNKEYEVLMTNIQMCKELPMIDLPQNFEDGLHEALVKLDEENKNLNDEKVVPLTKKNKKIKWKIFTSIAAIFVVFIISISAFNSIDMGTKEEISMNKIRGIPKAFENESMMEPSVKTQEVEIFDSTPKINAVQKIEEQKSSGRKVIKNAFVYIDIEDYDEKFNNIINMTESIGGYIEHSNTKYKEYVSQKPEESLKTGSITIRVPKKEFMNIIEKIKALGIVKNFGIKGEDITKQYKDVVHELENLKIQEKRLKEIMNKANNVKDILEVERELTRVRGQIDRMTGNIKEWDNLVSLSRIDIYLNEIAPKDKKIQPVNNNILDKGKKAFIRTVNNMMNFFEKCLILFSSILPIILLIGFIGFPIIWYLIKKSKDV